MKNTAQNFWFALSIFSVIVFLSSMAGAALAWEYRKSITRDLLPKLDAIELDLRSAQADLKSVELELASAQSEIDALQAALKTLGIDGAASLQALADLVGKLESTLTPFVSYVAERVAGLRDALLGIKATIEKINSLPLVNIDIPGVEQLDEAAATLQALQSQVEGGRDKVSQAAQITQDTVTALTTGFADLEASVQHLSAALGGYDAKISAYLIELDALQRDLPRWADWAAISLTLLFAWLGLSQVAVFALSYQLSTGQDLLGTSQPTQTPGAD